SVWPSSIAALVASNKAALFADGVVSDANSVPVTLLELAGTGTLRVRLGELSGSSGLPAIVVDSQFAASSSISNAIDSSAASIAAALRAVRTGQLPQHPAAAIAPSRLHAVFDTTNYPTMGARLL